MAIPDELSVWIKGQNAGTLHRDDAEINFTYDTAYADSDNPVLSISMPKSIQHHRHPIPTRWIDNLLPDNDEVRERWANFSGNRRVSPFALLAHMGADCAGAVQILPVDTTPGTDAGTITLSETDIAERLQGLRTDTSSWTRSDQPGQWSLGGAQGKFALTHKPNGAWAEPTGRMASTHIIKPGIARLPDADAAEYVSMRAAALLGINVADTALTEFGGQRALVSTRYDRHREPDGTITRIHQEDLCQALGISRVAKYQADGGPSVSDISDLLGTLNNPDRVTSSRELFAQGLAYNWLIIGTDAHAKNHSLLHEPHGRTRMAPLYDITSAMLLSEGINLKYKAKLSMKMGNEYLLYAIGENELRQAGLDAGTGPDYIIDKLRNFARDLPDAVRTAIDETNGLISKETAELFMTRTQARISNLPAFAKTRHAAKTSPATAQPPPSKTYPYTYGTNTLTNNQHDQPTP